MFLWPDGRRYEGQFSDGMKTGTGTMTWPSGNTYYGYFRDDQREGLGEYMWREGTFYRGFFSGNQMHGFGVKFTPESRLFFQKWDLGELMTDRLIVGIPRCQLSLDGRSWMFIAETCVNGVAHGRGHAVRLDGLAFIPNGYFVLGNLVNGETKYLQVMETEE